LIWSGVRASGRWAKVERIYGARAFVRAKAWRRVLTLRPGWRDRKAVRRWLKRAGGFTRTNRAAISAKLVGGGRGRDLWPETGGPMAAPPRPEELGNDLPRTGGVPAGRPGYGCFRRGRPEQGSRIPWAYSALFLAETRGFWGYSLKRDGGGASPCAIALGDLFGPQVDETRAEEEGIGNATLRQDRQTRSTL